MCMTQSDPIESDVIIELKPSPIRIWVAILSVSILGAFLLWVSASGATGSLLATLLFMVFAGLCFFGAHGLYRTRGLSLILRKDGLFENTGRTLCTREEIERIDRSFFALKPSNGFVVELKKPSARAWAPGLWWRFGKRVGVGGVTPIGESKAMADLMSIYVKGEDALLARLHNPFAR